MTQRFQMPAPTRPVVAIMTDRTDFHGHPAHLVLDGYVQALRDVAMAFPILVPSSSEELDLDTLLGTVDGVLLTGSPSNVAAERYGATPLPADTAQDFDRDATVLPVVRKLIESDVPMLGICRGFQEMNVAFGGSLHPAVHDLPGMLDHREGDHDRPIAQWYEDRHVIDIVPGGVLEPLAGGTQAQVNSLHHQGIARLGHGLRVEATAPDGLVEAFSVVQSSQFALAVQWHPEMRVADNSFARSIFSAFGTAFTRRNRERQTVGMPAL